MHDSGPERDFVAAEIRSLGDVLRVLETGEQGRELARVLAAVGDCLRSGGTLYIAGNGGSAADADHLAAEFVGRCTREHGPLPALALMASSATVTALANDYGYEQVFARQIRAFVRSTDVVLLLSTSGRSANVVAAARAARERGATVVAFVGQADSPLSEAADIAVHVPSRSTQRIQEVHKLWGHTLAAWIERTLD